MPDLFRGRFTGPQPQIRMAGNSVDIAYGRVRPVIWRRQSAKVELNASIPMTNRGVGQSLPHLTGDDSRIRALEHPTLPLEIGAAGGAGGGGDRRTRLAER